MNNPLISIILPTYNWNPKWLTESINSVLNQTYSNFELIIINDASTNNIEETILEFQKNDKRIIYIKNEKNLQLTKTLNKWIKLSKWEYIARIDDDDIWYDHTKLQKQVDFMEQNPDYWLCGTDTIIIWHNWKVISKIKMRSSDNEIKKNILKSNQFTHSSVIIRKKILQEVWWYYNEIYNWAEDYELWLRLWKNSKLYNINEFLVKYRWLNSSISRKKWLKQEFIALKIMLKNRKYYSNFYKSLILRILTIFIPQKMKKIIINLFKKWKK